MKSIVFVVVCIFSFFAIAKREPQQTGNYGTMQVKKDKVYKGTTKGFLAQDANSPKAVRTVISGELAKVIFNLLSVEPYTLSGQDGEQSTKESQGITCGHMSGTKDYFCSFNITETGI